MILSIIVPVYNVEKYLEKCVRSTQVQDVPSSEYEVIMINDGSPDNSLAIAERLAAELPNVKVFSQKNQGLSAARNSGMTYAKGDYYMFLDSDDLLAANCLQTRIETFFTSALEKCDFLIFPMGCFKQSINDTSQKWLPMSHCNHLLNFLSHRIPWQTMQPIWKREFLQSLKMNGFLGPFDEEYARLQDVEMHTRALLAGGKYKILEDAVPDCYYRIDLQRTDASRENQLSRQIQGFCQYLTKIGKLVSTRGRRYRAALRLSYFEALVTLCYWSNKREVSEEFEKEKLNELYAAAMSSNLLSAYHRLIIRLYVSLLRGRIKGINWLIRKLLMAF